MRKQKGIALVAALGVIIVVGIISAFVCRVAVVSNKVANRGGITLESRSNAESAMNAGYMALSKRIDQIETAADAKRPDDIIYDKKQYCSGSNRETCLWWQYDTDSNVRDKSETGDKFNGWISDKEDNSGDWHVFDLADTIKDINGDPLFKKGEALYRIEMVDGHPKQNASDVICKQWFRITARGLGYGGSRSYIQARIRVPWTCEGSTADVSKGIPDEESETKSL